jgi:hypothetical protein
VAVFFTHSNGLGHTVILDNFGVIDRDIGGTPLSKSAIG